MRRGVAVSALMALGVAVLGGCSGSPQSLKPNGCCISGTASPFGNPSASASPSVVGQAQPQASVSAAVLPPSLGATPSALPSSQACYVAKASDSAAPPYPGLKIALALPQKTGVAGSYLQGTLTITNTNGFAVNFFEQPPAFSTGDPAAAVELLAPGTQQVLGAGQEASGSGGAEQQITLQPRASRTEQVSVPLVPCDPSHAGSGLAAGSYDLRVGIWTTQTSTPSSPFYYWYAQRVRVSVVP